MNENISLFADVDLGYAASRLAMWEWLIEPEYATEERVLGVSSLGDVLVERDGVGLYLLSVRKCRWSCLPQASSRWEMLKEDGAFRTEYLFPDLVAALHERLGPLPVGHCYAPMEWNGRDKDLDSPAAYEVRDVYEFIAVSGFMYRLRDKLPDHEPYDKSTLLRERGRVLELLRAFYPLLVSTTPLVRNLPVYDPDEEGCEE